MAQDRTELPEGTDKVIAGASRTTSPTTGPGGTGGALGGSPTGGSIAGTGSAGSEVGGEDALISSGAATAPEALGGTGTPTGLASQGVESGGTVATTGTTGDATSEGGLTDRIRSGGEKLTQQAGEKARGLVVQGLERSAEALANVGRLVGDTAGGLDERLGPEYGDYARRAAEAIESTANNLASKDPDELIDDTRNFVRNSPGVAIAGAAIVGFALARLLKSSFARDDDEDDDGDTTGSRRSES